MVEYVLVKFGRKTFVEKYMLLKQNLQVAAFPMIGIFLLIWLFVYQNVRETVVKELLLKAVG